MMKSNNYGNSVLSDPAYRDKYKEKFLEAQKKGMDMVVYYDGTIALIENKITMYPYGWHKKKRDFERIKFGNESKRRRKSQVLQESSVAEKIDNSHVNYQKEPEFV
ncbi:hypothetical protein [Candidatus Neoehrlichia procyonis]|nr:hypothetical protein [Candidatus Neoehrlichia lotoris]